MSEMTEDSDDVFEYLEEIAAALQAIRVESTRTSEAVMTIRNIVVAMAALWLLGVLLVFATA